MRGATAILLAAGKGERLRSEIPKPLVTINSNPIIIYSLLALSRHPAINDIILVANAENHKNIIGKIKKYKIRKIRAVVEGGRRRQDSVYNGLQAIDKNTSLVLIHDSARPFIDGKQISAVINAAEKTGAAILGVPVKATVKEVTGHRSQVTGKFIVNKTLDRNKLWEIQTPQVFRKDLILEAYRRFIDSEVTDDAMLVEKLGHKVSVVLGSYGNIKITTPEDLIIARALAKCVR